MLRALDQKQQKRLRRLQRGVAEDGDGQSSVNFGTTPDGKYASCAGIIFLLLTNCYNGSIHTRTVLGEAAKNPVPPKNVHEVEDCLDEWESLLNELDKFSVAIPDYGELTRTVSALVRPLEQVNEDFKLQRSLLSLNSNVSSFTRDSRNEFSKYLACVGKLVRTYMLDIGVEKSVGIARTALCSNFEKGRCTRGPACHFKHELPNSRPGPREAPGSNSRPGPRAVGDSNSRPGPGNRYRQKPVCADYNA